MKWTQDEAIAFECARDVITDLMSILTAEIADEESKPTPDTLHIEQLENERSRLFQERRYLRVKDHKEIARIRTEYGAKFREWRAKQSTELPIPGRIEQETFEYVWDAIADSPEEAAALKAKSDLMHQVIKLALERNVSISELGLKCDMSQEGIENIEHRRFARVNVFDLFKLAAGLGYQVDIQLVAQR